MFRHINKLIQKIILYKWCPYLWLAFVGSALYYQSLFYGYTFDDYRLIVVNYHYIGSINNIFLAFTKSPYWQSITPFYRPILTLSFMFDALIGGQRPFIYHLTNILIHIAACISLFMFLQKLSYNKKTSFVVSLLFCAHPVLVQAVAWIPGRNDSLMTLFALLSFMFMIDYNAKDKWQCYLLHISFLLAALFTKETAILMPAIFMLYRYLFTQEKMYSAKAIKLYLGWAFSVLLYLGARHAAINSNGIYINSLSENLIGLGSYIGKAVFPAQLTVLPIPENINILYGITALVLIACAAVMMKPQRVKAFIFWGVWFLLTMLPTIIRVTDFASFLEQRLYLPLVGLGIALLETKNSRYRIVSLMPRYLLVPVLIGFCLITVRHIKVFANSHQYWQNAVKTSPDSYFAHHMLGNYYLGSNAFDLAEQEYLKSIRLNSRYANNYDKMFLIGIAKGDSIGAEEWLLKAIDPERANPYSYNAYGVYLLEKNNYSGAESQFKQALGTITNKTNPEILPVVYYNLGLTDLRKGTLAGALAKFEKALQLNPMDAMVHHQIGLIKFNQGLWNEADIFLSRAVELDSSYGEAHDYLGMTRLNLGDYQGALREISMARTLMPQNPLVYEHLSFVSYQMGHYEKASAYYDSSITMGLTPDPEVLSFLLKYRKTDKVK